MHPTSRPIGVDSFVAPRCSPRSKGFTLVEVMIAGGVFVMATFGLYSILLRSYQLNALARYNDDARAVLRTYADQFQRLQTADLDPIRGQVYTRELFRTTAETGQGMRFWYSDPLGALSVELSSATSFANGGDGVPVTLGGIDNGVLAHVYHKVQAIDPGPAATGPHVGALPGGGGAFGIGTSPSYAAGSLLLGTFTIKYPFYGRTIVQSLSILRAAP